MKLLIHDLEDGVFRILLPLSPDRKDIAVISDDGTIFPCIGCFGCWIKTPASCVIRDQYGDMGALLSRCGELIIISRCVYGSYSPFVKNVLDRTLSYLLPDFVIRGGETRHKMRYNHSFSIQAWFYGEDLTESERNAAQRLVRANAANIGAVVRRVSFVQALSELRGNVL